MKIAIAGAGYVGLSCSMILAQNHEVIVHDTNIEKVNKLKKSVSPIIDPDIENFLRNKNLNFTATIDMKQAYTGADFVIIATPTDYDTETNYFNTASIEAVIQDVQLLRVVLSSFLNLFLPFWIL